jgi:hypothetical protein
MENSTVTRVPQKCRLLKVACPLCGLIIRMTKKYINAGRVPTCACGARMALCVEPTNTMKA